MRNRRGFTLIELLVVIAIIAILAAILFPVFAQAREKARQTTCASDEKQLGLGFMQYVQDYDEKFPMISSTTLGVPSSLKYWPYAVYPYVKSGGVFICPDDPQNYANYTSNQTVAEGIANPNTTPEYWELSSYGLNFGLMNGNVATPFTLSAINFPSETALVSENYGVPIKGQCYGAYFGGGFAGSGTTTYASGEAGMWYSGTDTPVVSDPFNTGNPAFDFGFQTPYARHTGGANMIFTDGHVKLLKFSAIYALPPGVTNPANFRLWHPTAL